MKRNEAIANRLADHIFKVGAGCENGPINRLAFMRIKSGKEIAGGGLNESALAETLLHALNSYQEPVETGPVRRQFELATGGRDPEIDAIGIVIEVLKDMQGYEIARVLEYLRQRYTVKP